MHIIFGNLTSWQVPILKLLKCLKFEVFYVDIAADSDSEKNKIAKKLKKKNIIPVPIGFEKKIPPTS